MALTLPSDSRGHPFRFVAGIMRNIIIALVDSYAVSVMLLLLGRLMIGERWTVIAFFNTFLHLLWLPALVLLPVFLLLRQKRTALLLSPAVLGFIITYGGQFMPRAVAQSENPAQLTILSYNLLDDGSDMSGRIAVIREANADMVALQEYSYEADTAVRAQLADMYPYMALHPNDQGTEGQGFLSRYPFSADDYWQYAWLPVKLGHQRVLLDIDSVPVVLYNVHPTHPGMTGSSFFNPEYRSREIQDLLQRLESESGHVLMMGDFNMPDLSDDYARITARYQDAYRAAGWGLGWSFPILPLLRLDYVFYNSGFQPLEAQVWRTSGGSDHRALLVKMAVLDLSPGIAEK